MLKNRYMSNEEIFMEIDLLVYDLFVSGLITEKQKDSVIIKIEEKA